jgi:UDP-N-acetyl-D-mannosaminuronic acid dehydrogenase
LIRAARQVNSGKPLRVAEQVVAACRAIENPTVACLGLAYKADVGDLRESPAIAVVERLQEACPGRLLVVEPHIDELPAGLAGCARTELVGLDDALGAELILLLTDHREFRGVDPGCLSGKRIIDTRGIWRA